MTGQPPEATYADDAHRYRLDSRIAVGGMGEVWRATDTVLERPVAVKLLKEEYADDRSFRARFETEAHHAASLLHPNIATVYDFGEAAPSAAGGSALLSHRPYLVMELVDGRPLSTLLRPGEPLDAGATRELLAQVADGLGAAHEAGIVHRDVKPANLLVTPDRHIKITDFGIARATHGSGLTQTGEVMGTPQYISPEQARGEPATPASDVYALGVVAFECLAGRRPYVAETAIATALAHVREPVPDLPEHVPADLAAVVRRAMAKLPADRFPDGAAFAAALRDPATAVTAVVAGGALAAPVADATQVIAPAAAEPAEDPTLAAGAPPLEETPVRRGTRNALLPALTGLALVILAVVVVLLLTRDTSSEPERRPRNPLNPTTSASRTPSPGATGGPSTPATSAPTTSAPPTSSAPATSQPPTTQSPTSQPPTPTGSPTSSPTATGTASPGTGGSPTASPTGRPTGPTSPSTSRGATGSPTASPNSQGEVDGR